MKGYISEKDRIAWKKWKVEKCSQIEAYLFTHSSRSDSPRFNAEKNASNYFKTLTKKIQCLPFREKLKLYLDDEDAIEDLVKLTKASTEVYHQGEMIGEKKDNKVRLDALRTYFELDGKIGSNAGESTEAETADNELKIVFDNEE